MGKATIDTNTYGKSTGRSGNHSTNYQLAGRELMMPDEVRALDNGNAILFIRGEKPIIDAKYNIFTHPNILDTPFRGAATYSHGSTDAASASVSLTTSFPAADFFASVGIPEADQYELLYDDEEE